MRLYYRGAAFCKKMREKLSKMSENRNIRDHKHCSQLKLKDVRKLFVKIPIPAGSLTEKTNGLIPYLESEMLTGRESKWGTSLPPVSISCQVCFPDIDYVQGSTLGKIESHRV
ncbi:orf112a (mitochondrion) [Beta vulgaris subsp. vulgaris]|uniref:Orf112a protein n=1 Tax=Beta vulgaris subsp. vulgaris TaxID=3555 RepID=Q9MF97_BETVV|nr:orf112a [Beta vulgaris subsp. vulgaris]BAA99353.1 orf112a [Beta vulgaris subsp. vulgaris]